MVLPKYSESSISRRYEKRLSDIRDYVEAHDSSHVAMLQAADMLREWIFRNTPKASGEKETLSMLNPFKHSTVWVLEELRKSRTGFWCAGFASMLVCAYRDMGLNAAIVSFGIEQYTTHATTAVEIDGSWYLQDPYINARYTLHDKSDASLADIWKAINQGASIKVQLSPRRLQILWMPKGKLCDPSKVPYGKHVVSDKQLVLCYVSQSDFFKCRFWFGTERQMLLTPDQDPLTSLFCTLLWISHPKTGFYEDGTTHPYWKEMVKQPEVAVNKSLKSVNEK